jgi:ubiquinone/menaquinone biosynthesis C-methylase UbiE
MRHAVEEQLRFYEQRYGWPRDGDEWDGQARACGQPYDAWKQSLVETFLVPNVPPGGVVLEIGAGHGRWSKAAVPHCGELILVDLSPRCVEFCQRLLARYDHVRYLANDGLTLTGVADGSVDLVWAFDTFVQIDRATIESYLGEIRRVLKPGGRAVLHHAGRAHAFLWLGFLMYWKYGKRLYKLISMGELRDTDGWRSNVSRRLFHRLATGQGLTVEAQVRSWGPAGEFGVPRFGDHIAVLRKAARESIARGSSYGKERS